MDTPFQEFYVEIKDKKESENVIVDHLSRLVNKEVTCNEGDIHETFSDEVLIFIQKRPWFADMENFKVVGVLPKQLKWKQKNKFLHDAKQFVWDDPFLFKIGAYNLLRRCVITQEAVSILWHYHNFPYEGHYNGERTTLRCYNPYSISLLYLKMLMYMHGVMINVNGLGTYLEDMRCHWKLS